MSLCPSPHSPMSALLLGEISVKPQCRIVTWTDNIRHHPGEIVISWSIDIMIYRVSRKTCPTWFQIVNWLRKSHLKVPSWQQNYAGCPKKSVLIQIFFSNFFRILLLFYLETLKAIFLVNFTGNHEVLVLCRKLFSWGFTGFTCPNSCIQIGKE